MPVEEVQAEEASSETPNTQLEDAVFETPIETETFEASITEETPLEELQAAQIEPENQDLDESTTEAAETEPADEEETLTIDNSPPEEQPVAEAPDEIVTATEEVIVEETAEPVDDVPLHTFNVTEHEPLETTLEKVIEPTSEEHVIEPVILGEANIQAHPLEAPHQAPTEIALEQMDEAQSNDTSPADENDENTTE